MKWGVPRMVTRPTLVYDSHSLPVGIDGVRLRGREVQFVGKVIDVVRRNIADADLDTFILSRELGYSRMHVNRRLQQILGCSTRAFVRLVRLDYARRLLQEGDLSVSRVARSAGFRSASHFSHAFKCMWGLSPSRLRIDQRNSVG